MKIANARAGDSDDRTRPIDLSPTTPERLEWAVCAAASKRAVFLYRQTGHPTSQRPNLCDV